MLILILKQKNSVHKLEQNYSQHKLTEYCKSVCQLKLANISPLKLTVRLIVLNPIKTEQKAG